MLAFIAISFSMANAQKPKILFDATKAETAGNADWIVDADVFNLGYTNGKAVAGTGNEANAQATPSPKQKSITASTVETFWKGALSNWGIDCAKKGYTVKTLPYNGRITYNDASNGNDLSKYNVFIVCEPNIVFTAAEKTAIINYVKNGGSLFMISDHNASDRNNDGWDSPNIWNDLMTNNTVQNNPFGISFDLQSFSETSTNIANLPNDSILHGSAGNVSTVLWSSGTSMTISQSANATVKGIIYRTGASNTGTTQVMFAYCSFGRGKVAAIGDSSPCDDGTGDTNDALYNGYTGDASGNHQRLLMNATIWLVNKAALKPQANSFTVKNITSKIGVYPNPTSNKAVINFANAGKNTTVKLYNAQGNALLFEKVAPNTTTKTIDISKLTAGTYWIVLETNGKKLSSGVIVKQ